MNHPNSQEWMSYLYGEVSRQDKAHLKSHLRDCAQCRQQLESWQTSGNGLDLWKLDRPAVNRIVRMKPPLLKWALAALLILGLGYGLGRLSAPAPDLGRLQAALEPRLRASLTSDLQHQILSQLNSSTASASHRENERLWADFLQTYTANRREDRQATLTLLRQLEDKRQADMFNLRRALETVAVVAADKFQRTDSELGQLASYSDKLNPSSTNP